MCWGDVLLKKTSDGKEYLQFNERSTQTRSGAKVGDIRPVPPRAFAVESEAFCPVQVYKEYRKHRPIEMCKKDSRFYLRALVDPTTDVWFSQQTVGKDKLGKFMKDMAEEGNLEGRKVNHSGRKTFATSLLQNGKAVTEVAQLGGWKNIQSVTNYAVPSLNQQEDNSNIISSILMPSECSDDIDAATKSMPVSLVDSNNNTATTVVDLVPVIQSENLFESIVQMSSCTSKMQSDTKEKKDNPMNLFQGAVISGGTININIMSEGSKKKNLTGHYLSNEIVSSQE